MSEGREEAREEKLSGDVIVVESKFLKKFENFWFYHKWHLLIALLAIILVFIIVDQMAQNESDDIVILTSGPYKPSATQNLSVSSAFSEIMPSDFNGDGEKRASSAHVEVYSKEQLEKLIDEYKNENSGKSPVINSSMNAENLKNFNNLIMAGEYSICIIDEWLYEDIKSAGGLRPLSDFYDGKLPEYALDEYALSFKDLPFAKHYTCFEDFPPTTVICMRTKGVMGSWLSGDKGEKKYAQAEEMFKAILSFVPSVESK